VDKRHPVERKRLAAGVPSAELQITEAYPGNLHCSLSALGKRIQFLRDGKGHTTHSTWSYPVRTDELHAGFPNPKFYNRVDLPYHTSERLTHH
jgi:hypothetical protein